MGLVTPAEVSHVAPQNEGGTQTKLRLPEFIVGQRTGFDKDPGKMSEAYNSLFGEQGKVSDLSKRIYAEVLTDEYMALQKVLKADPSVDLPVWSNQFQSALQIAFKEKYPNKDMTHISDKQKGELYKAVFNSLLLDHNEDEAHKWINAGMIAAKHQVVAMQAATGAKYEGTAFTKPGHISEPTAVSPYFESNPDANVESTINEVSQLRESQKAGNRRKKKTKLWPVSERVKKFRDDLKTDLLSFQSKTNAASNNNYYALVDVNMPYDEAAIPDTITTIDNAPLDAVQQAYLQSIYGVGSRENGMGLIDVGGRKAVEQKMKRIGAANMETYNKLYDIHITNPSFLNTIIESGRTHPGPDITQIQYIYAEHPSLQSVVTGIDGIPALPHGFRTMSFEEQMTFVMSSIDHRTQEYMDNKKVGQTRTSVDAQISTLEATSSTRKLTHQEEEEHKHITTEVGKLEKTQQTLEDYEKTKESIHHTEESIAKQEAQIPEAITADNEIEGKKEELSNGEKDKAKIKDQIDLLQGEITDKQKRADDLGQKINETQSQIDTLRMNIGSLTAPNKQGEREQKEALVTRLEGSMIYWRTERGKLLGEISNNKAKLQVGNPMAAPPVEALNDRMRDVDANIDALTKQIKKYQEILDDPDNKPKLESIKALKKQKARDEASLKAIEKLIGTKQTDGTYVLPDLEKINKEIKDLKAREGKLTLEDPVIKHKQEVLSAYRDIILDSSNYMAIRNRAQEPIVDPFTTQNNRNPEALASILAAQERMPWVPASYLATIRVIGSDEALEYSSEGTQLYEDIYKLVTPDRFFQTFMSDRAKKLEVFSVYNAYQATVGGAPIPNVDDMPDSIFDDVYSLAEVQQVMTKHINENFIRNILSSLQNDALAKKLGDVNLQRADLMQKLAYESDDPSMTPEKYREKLEHKTETAEHGFSEARDRRVMESIQEVRRLAVTYGATPEQVPTLITDIHEVIVANGLFFDINNDDLEPVATNTRTQLGIDIDAVINRMNLATLTDTQRVELVNKIRINAIAPADVAPYREGIHLVEQLGIPAEKSEYVISAVKRALVNANIQLPVTHDNLMNADGNLTDMGRAVEAELGKVNVHVDINRMVSIVNDAGKLSVPQFEADPVEIKAVLAGIDEQKMQYTAIAARRVIESIRNLAQNTIDDVIVAGDPRIRQRLTDELNKIGVDINAIAVYADDAQVAQLLESVRLPSRNKRLDLEPRSTIEAAVTKAGIDKQLTADVVTALAFRLDQAGIKGRITLETLNADPALQTQIKDSLKTIVPVADVDALAAEQLLELTNSVAGEKFQKPLETSNVQAKAVEDVLRKYIRYGRDNPSAYQEAILLAVATSSLDADAAEQVAKAIDSLTLSENPNWDIPSVVSNLPAELRSYVLNNTAAVRGDIQARYDAAFPGRPSPYEEIEIDILRKLADESLMARRGIINPPYDQTNDRERVQFSSLLNNALDVETHDIRLDDYSNRFWGSNDTYQFALLLSQQEGLQPEEALMYAKTILEQRIPKGGRPERKSPAKEETEFPATPSAASNSH